VNQQLAFAGWTLPSRIDDDRVHRRVDDLLSAEWANKRVVEELEFDGRTPEILPKQVFYFLSPHVQT
jgi:hypothetical protein